MTSGIILTRRLLLSMTLASGFAGHSSGQAAGLEPIPVKLPKPMFEGTPENVEGVARIEKPLGRPRPPFLAPAGVRNVALDMLVTSSDPDPAVGAIEMITDGDKGGGDGSFVELAAGVQHVTIDIEEEFEIYAILFWHYHKQARVYFDVVVQVAADPDFIMDVRTLFNNDHDNSAGLGIGDDLHYVETAEGKLVDAKGHRARFVRLYSNGSNASGNNHYVEVEVFGKPVE